MPVHRLRARNTENLPPAVKGVIAKYMPVQVPQDAAESLKKGGLDPSGCDYYRVSELLCQYRRPLPIYQGDFCHWRRSEGSVTRWFPPHSDIGRPRHLRASRSYTLPLRLRVHHFHWPFPPGNGLLRRRQLVPRRCCGTYVGPYQCFRPNVVPWILDLPRG